MAIFERFNDQFGNVVNDNFRRTMFTDDILQGGKSRSFFGKIDGLEVADGLGRLCSPKTDGPESASLETGQQRLTQPRTCACNNNQGFLGVHRTSGALA